MEELGAAKLLIAALFGLPGYVFLHILTRFTFKTTRAGAGRTVFLLTAFVVSLVLCSIVDSEFFRECLSNVLNLHQAEVGPPAKLWFYPFDQSFSKELLKTLFETKSEGIGDAIRVVYYLTIFSVILSALASTLLNFVTLCARVNFGNHLLGFIYLTEFCVRKIARLERVGTKYLSDSFRKTSIYSKLLIIRKKPTARIAVGLFQLLTKSLFLLLVVGFVGATLILFFALAFPAVIINLVLFGYQKVMSLFKHPGEELFEPRSPGKQGAVTVVEILSKEDKINKGVYLNFFPRNPIEIDSIAITHVIQYTKQKVGTSFSTDNREVYVFPRKDSVLTISRENICDINVSHFNYSDFRWNFKVLNQASLENQMWYLRIMLKHHKGYFNLRRFQAWIDTRFAPHFFLELLKLLNEQHSGFFYVYRLRSLVRDLQKIWSQYHKAWKRALPTMDPTHQEEVRKATTAFAAYLKLVNKRFKHLR